MYILRASSLKTQSKYVKFFTLSFLGVFYLQLIFVDRIFFPIDLFRFCSVHVLKTEIKLSLPLRKAYCVVVLQCLPFSHMRIGSEGREEAVSSSQKLRGLKYAPPLFKNANPLLDPHVRKHQKFSVAFLEICTICRIKFHLRTLNYSLISQMGRENPNVHPSCEQRPSPMPSILRWRRGMYGEED